MLTGIPPAPRGTPQIEVSFDIDANGILNVSAKDLATAKKQGITISASNKLSKDEVGRMVKQAEEFAAEDRKRAEAAETRNRGESLAYEAERLLKDNPGKIAETDASEVRAKVQALRDKLDSKDVGEIQTRIDDLTKTLHGVAQKMYQSAGAGPAGTSEGTPPERESGPESGPVDADFKVVDKEPGEEKGES
jgi:molecular chaperone DnaK